MNSKISFKVTDRFEKGAFSRFVYENLNTSIFQTLEMADVYKRNKSCKPLTLAVINEDTGEILATLLAKILEEKPGFLSSFSRHSTIRGGPIFVDGKDGIEAVSLLMEHYNKIVAKDALYSRIYPLNDTPPIIPCFKENGYEYEYWQNFLIDLNKSREELWKNLKEDKKKAVRKAKKKGLQVCECTGRGEIQIFYELVKERYVKRKNPFEGISNFKAVFDILGPKNEARFLFVKYNDEYIATRLILLYKGVIYAWYSGSNSNYLKYYPNDLITWHVMEWGSNNDYHTFDFGGGGELHEDKAGWVEFKRRFGSKSVNYGRYTKVHKPVKLWFAEKAFALYRKMLLR